MSHGWRVRQGTVPAGDLRDGLAAGGRGLGGSTRKLTKQEVKKLALIARGQLAELFENFSGSFAHKAKIGRGLGLARGFQPLSA